MTSLIACPIRDSRLLGLEREKGSFQSRRSLSSFKKYVPLPRDDDGVVLAPFYARGFGLPLHPFIRGLLFFYELEIQNLHPNSFLHMACFIILCEAFLRIDPH